MRSRPCGDTWEPQVLEKLIKRHAQVNAHLKAQGKKKGYVICALTDDFADSSEKVMHSSTNVLTSLLVRGCHLGCLLVMKAKAKSFDSNNYDKLLVGSVLAAQISCRKGPVAG